MNIYKGNDLKGFNPKIDRITANYMFNKYIKTDKKGVYTLKYAEIFRNDKYRVFENENDLTRVYLEI